MIFENRCLQTFLPIYTYSTYIYTFVYYINIYKSDKCIQIIKVYTNIYIFIDYI